MKYSYKFNNLIGSIYRSGNVVFTPDGSSIIAPVGNRLNVFNLKKNKSQTIQLEAKHNIVSFALSPDGIVCFASTDNKELLLISLISQSIIRRQMFAVDGMAIAFAPDGSKVGVTKDKLIYLLDSPEGSCEMNPFSIAKKYHGATAENVCVDWSPDSSAMIAGCVDGTARIFFRSKSGRLLVYSFTGNADVIVDAYLTNNDLDVLLVVRNGAVKVFQSQSDLSIINSEKSQVKVEPGEYDQDTKEEEANFDDQIESVHINSEKSSSLLPLKYKTGGFFHTKNVIKVSEMVYTISSAYHKPTSILALGQSNGTLLLLEMPSFNLLHSLHVCDFPITAMTFNSSGDWLGMGVAKLGQLIVWDWKSQTFVMKQQSHHDSIESVVYSPDSRFLATGASDGKVKIWNERSGFCIVTFTDHKAGVTAVNFAQSGKSVVSASLDGTVRAFDMKRYRNFRTFVPPPSVETAPQFGSVSVIESSLVAASVVNPAADFDIFVWSFTTGHLLETIGGHESPVSCLAFSPPLASYSAAITLATGSWDKTVRLNRLASGSGKNDVDVIDFTSDVSTLAWRPDGRELAVATTNGHLTTVDTGNEGNVRETHFIESGPVDLGLARLEGDKVTARTLGGRSYFTCLVYTPDGRCILAGARASKNVCMYDVNAEILIKKFALTINLSFDGVQMYKNIKKQGTPMILHEVKAVDFSPTGSSFAVANGDGVTVFSTPDAENLFENSIFDPLDLTPEVSPEVIKQIASKGSHAEALTLAIRLNDPRVMEDVFNSIPVSSISLVNSSIAQSSSPQLLEAFARRVLAEQLQTSQRLEFVLLFVHSFLKHSLTKLHGLSSKSILTSLQKAIIHKSALISRFADDNEATLDFLLETIPTHKTPKETMSHMQGSASDNDSESSKSETAIDLNDIATIF